MLPKGYKKGLDRVSSIVDSVYPFKGAESFEKRLEGLSIEKDEYMNTATTWGTVIHKIREDYIGGKILDKIPIEISNIAISLTKRIDSLSPVETIETEIYTRDKEDRFQGMADLLYKKGGKYILGDYKSFGVAKLKYDNIENKGKLAVEKKKREKTRLQMSIYAYAIMDKRDINIDRVELIYTHTLGIRVYKMELLPRNEVEKIISDYFKNKDIKEKYITF